MLFRITVRSTSRTFDVCPAAVAVLMTKQHAAMCGGNYDISLHEVETVEQVNCSRGSTLRCDHHNGWLSSCP